MKKALIITLNGDVNFGNKLQNYALKNILLNYFDDVETASYKESIAHILKIKVSELFKEHSIDKKKKKKFSKFNELLNYSKMKFCVDNVELDTLNNYDFVFYGSDQVWRPYNYGIPELLGGKGAAKEKNIAYAASFGISKIEDKYAKNFEDTFKRFKSIGLRENNGLDIVKKFGYDEVAVVVLDPTMLLETNQWDKLVVEPINKPKRRFILNYFLGELSSNKYKQIKEIADKYNCDIINILDKNDTAYISGPGEFLYYEKNAFLICTDSFHSSVFAILYNKPFIVFERNDNLGNMNSRLETLINKFELKDRFYNGREITTRNLKCDYTTANDILMKERNKSIEFIEESIGLK